MTDREKILIDYLTNSEVALNQLQEDGFTFLDSSFIWQVLIYKYEHYDIPTNVLLEELSADKIISDIRGYFAEHGLPLKNVSLDSTIIPDELNDSLQKARIKFQGEIWTIHNADKDHFPSQPHAHNYDRQYKLHLGNGLLYRKKIICGQINKKNFLLFREIIETKLNLTLPKLEII